MLGRTSLFFLLMTAAPLSIAAAKKPMDICEQHKPTVMLLSNEQKELMDQAGRLLVRSSALRMAAERDSTFTDIYQAPTGQEDPEIKQLLSRLSTDAYRRILNHQINSDESNYKHNIQAKIASKKDAAAVLLCHQAQALYEPRSKANKDLKVFLKAVLNRPSSAQVEYFDITIDSCTVRDDVGARNRASEPEPWPGSRYLVIQAAFKNTDTESRLPFAGSALVSMKGKTFEYDNTETVFEQGFGIGLQPVGPLLTLRTKIVYRIPQEVTGEIFWRPGRNPEQSQLWCNSI